MKKNKPRKDGIYTESLNYVYYCVFFNFLTVKELSTERIFIVCADKLIQHIYYKGMLTSKVESKDMILWKRGSFVFTEDETLWIASRAI